MALSKTGYTDAIRGTTRVDVAIDTEGYIAPVGVTAAGTKKFQINSVNSDNTLTDNTEVLDFFLTLANGRGDSLSNDMSVKWTV
jgi:hypothetical protein